MDNACNGTWHFMIHEQNNDVTYAQWKAAPYSQDAGSTP